MDTHELMHCIGWIIRLNVKNKNKTERYIPILFLVSTKTIQYDEGAANVPNGDIEKSG
jgi:hypothetical protein